MIVASSSRPRVPRFFAAKASLTDVQKSPPPYNDLLLAGGSDSFKNGTILLHSLLTTLNRWAGCAEILHQGIGADIGVAIPLSVFNVPACLPSFPFFLFGGFIPCITLREQSDGSPTKFNFKKEREKEER